MANCFLSKLLPPKRDYVTKIVGKFNFIEQITSYFIENWKSSKLLKNITNFLYTHQQASNLCSLLVSGKFYLHLRVIYL